MCFPRVMGWIWMDTNSNQNPSSHHKLSAPPQSSSQQVTARGSKVQTLHKPRSARSAKPGRPRNSQAFLLCFQHHLAKRQHSAHCAPLLGNSSCPQKPITCPIIIILDEQNNTVHNGRPNAMAIVHQINNAPHLLPPSSSSSPSSPLREHVLLSIHHYYYSQ